LIYLLELIDALTLSAVTCGTLACLIESGLIDEERDLDY
jgi:hypothetical protein